MAEVDAPPAPGPRNLRQLIKSNRTWQKIYESAIQFGLFLCGVFSVVVTVAIALVVLHGSWVFFTTNDGEPISGQESWDRAVQFFTGGEWTAPITPMKFGIWPLLTATFMVAVIAAAIALPIGLLTAIYLSEYATPRVRAIAKPALELLAGIPTVVYGFFAITVVTPWLVGFIPGLGNPDNQLSGGIVVGIMIIPLVASLSEDALRAVPRSLRDGAIALGANKFETSVKVVLPAALSGVTASFLLAISRAVGETMAVALACGGTARFSLDPRVGAATMTGFIVKIAKGDLPHGTTVFNSLFAIAALLFFITLFMNIIAQFVLRRYRMVYQ